MWPFRKCRKDNAQCIVVVNRYEATGERGYAVGIGDFVKFDDRCVSGIAITTTDFVSKEDYMRSTGE